MKNQHKFVNIEKEMIVNIIFKAYFKYKML